ncbi:hypothetical protein [Streptomyces sp. NPDC046925]|uniref:hypothetical protein n=1 Tax=Streptomyces sp. NPDC046925 TaxID=3155375 RepID=UPI0033C04B16
MNSGHQPAAPGHRDEDPAWSFGSFPGLDGDPGTWSKTSPAPGAPLPRFRPSLTLERTRFTARLPDTSTVTVDVDHVAGLASLYRGARHVQTAEMPVRFACGADRIDVAASRYGMERIHLVGADGSRRRLDPAPGTPEYWRARLSRRHPGLGRALAVAAIVVPLANLTLIAPRLLATITQVPWWADHFAPFVSPIHPPAWANTALTITAGLAGVERALTFRHHRLLDAATDGMTG